MTRHLVPTRSGVHRLACLSLYHTLLSQCSRSWLGSKRSNVVRDFITTRFRRDKSLQSPTQIIGSLKGGYEALDLLHSCSQGHGESIRRFNRLFAATLALREEIAYRAHQREEVVEQPRQNFRVAWDQAARERSAREAGLAPGDRRLPEQPKPAESILDRPRLHVSGRRRIPRFVNARGVPFLRIKKPIPASLSRVIRQKLKRKQDRVNRRVILDNLLLIAEMEDDWDLRTGQAEKNSTWTSAVEESVSALEEAIEETNQKDYVMAQRMWNVVLKEMELAEQERQERERQTGQR